LAQSVLAKWWKSLDNNKVLCTLCPRFCKIGAGQNGFCFIRKNEGGKLYQKGYGTSTGFAIDPIEKKPLNHFLPGSSILSFGTVGCNLGCRFCQNWDISKSKMDERRLHTGLTAEKVVQLAIDNQCPSIAYTYNDPTIWSEWVIDIAKIAREADIKNVMVTAGYITPEAREEIYPFINAANVDFKSITETFYHKLTFSHLADVLDTIIWLVKETDVWVELTNLIIPGFNDSVDEIHEMVDWILNNLGDEVPLHFTAFHPDFKMTHIPATPPETLTKTRDLAIEKGVKYVYVGNVFDINGQTTHCPNCHKSLIVRNWHTVVSMNLIDSTCECGQNIPIIQN